MKTKPKITPFLVPSYTPEVELMIVAGGIFTFQSGNDQNTSRSTVPFNIGYSTNNSKEIDTRPVIYTSENKGRFFGRIIVRDMPDHYFGTGYNNGRRTEQSDSTSFYQRLWWQFDLNFIRRVMPDFYAGLRLDFNRTSAWDLNDLMVQDPLVQSFGTDIQNSGLGILLQYDSRDFEINAHQGLLILLNATSYGTVFKSDFPYTIYTFDYRHFKTIFRPGRVLAWEIRMDIGSGDIPWPELPKLGTPFNLRGYRFGRYRDKTTGFGLLEYRHTFQKKRSNQVSLSRHGIVGWVATGSLGQNMREWTQWLPNVGMGYRFEVQPRVNVRVDFGFGMESNGLYLSFNEAF